MNKNKIILSPQTKTALGAGRQLHDGKPIGVRSNNGATFQPFRFRIEKMHDDR